MKAKRMPFSILGAGAVLVLAGLTGCPLLFSHEFVGQPYTETRDFAAGGQLNIESLVGDVTVTAWEQNMVSITYRKRVTVFYPSYSLTPDPSTYFDQMAVVIETSADTPGLSVRDVMPETIDRAYNPSIALDVKIPAHTILNIVQNVGNVTVTGVHGALDVQVNVGDLTLHHPKPLADESIKGAIADVGDIKLYVPEGSAFDADAATQIGHVRADDFWSINIQQQGYTGAYATGRVNGGGADVTFDVNIGDIAFLRD